MLLLPLTLLLFTCSSFVEAGSFHKNQPCNLARNRLQVGSYQFFSECDSQTYCNSSSLCDKRTCRRDDFPFGYSQDSSGIPDKCPKGQFCPDEEDKCQPLLAVGSPCQLNRDDQCEAPPNFKDLADTTNRGLNVNGSVCLNNVCMWANVTLGQPCVVENVAYIAYGDSGGASGGASAGGEFIDIVSRGNCRLGLYCDAQQKVCVQAKQLNAGCGADKECDSFNCLDTGVCGVSADTPNHFPVWVYAVVAIGIFGGMFGTLFLLFIFHRRQRDEDREKRLQYWREQNAFRQNIMQMRDTATSILSLPNNNSRRNSDYSRDGLTSVDSQAPMLQYAAAKSSGLRHYTSEYGDDDSFTMEPPVERRPDGRF